MAQVQFFATLEDEEKLFKYLSNDTTLKCSVVDRGILQEWESISELKVSDFNLTFELYFWNTGLGKISWLREKPKMDFSTNSKLVKSVIDRENWNQEKERKDFDNMAAEWTCQSIANGQINYTQLLCEWTSEQVCGDELYSNKIVAKFSSSKTAK